MRVFRIQTKDGTGAYRGPGGEMQWVIQDHYDDNHPTANRDGFLDNPLFTREYFFAFESMELLHKWFNSDELLKLGRMGYFIAEFECPDDMILRGKSNLQVTFKRGASLLIGYKE